MSNIVPSFHLGQILHTYIKKHRLSQAALARDINKSPRAIAMYLKRPSLQVNTLMELCIGLRYNFFSDLAAMLPESLPPETLSLIHI
mgnify:FL=1